MAARSCSDCFAQTFQCAVVRSVVSVRKIEPGHVHAGIDETTKTFNGPACRPQCADDLGPSVLRMGVFPNVVESANECNAIEN
jgi:hypothetical protein